MNLLEHYVWSTKQVVGTEGGSQLIFYIVLGKENDGFLCFQIHKRVRTTYSCNSHMQCHLKS